MTSHTHRRPAALPGFSSPAAGFDDPMAMLEACHDRIRRSLDLLGRLCDRVSEGRIDAAVQEAAADVLRYFDRAAPHHHEDEERHIFPCVLAHSGDPALRAAVLRLQADHLAMEAQWAQLRTPLAALASGHAEGFAAAQLEAARRFIGLYAEHTRLEEALVFPAAAAALDQPALQRIGADMAERRGAPRP
ncbi:hemerythrin domain-containing protein [Piscinibacter sp. XHJ-5]|uniref:hemerythrin domain-containing protein n=1 Tax=Piscinibacter sp. XHJ-5 TaxID=3037797 RepID=UPI00245286E3|nr:hemerythrin domain-containing protein [Piscinibacter sp. XHJ-5]